MNLPEIKHIENSKIASFVDVYLYLKICWGQAWGHLSMPMVLLDKVLLAGVFLKVFGINKYWLIVVVGIIGVIIMIWLGHLIVKHGVLPRETSIANRFNPELTRILRNTEKENA